jgi:hypothetical protein
MQEYRIRNKSTNKWWDGMAENANDAMDKAGWPAADCEIKERTYGGGGGWKKVKEGDKSCKSKT